MIYRAAAVLWVAGFMAVAWGRSEAVPSGSSLSRAEAESPAAAKSIDALLSEAGNLGYEVEPLRNKLLEGRAKGKSDEAILKALRLRMYKMESSSQLSPSKKGFERALFLLEASPKNTEGKLALDEESTKPEKKISSPPVSHSKSARAKTKSVQAKKEPVWMPARAKAEPPKVPGSNNRSGLSNGGKPGNLDGSGAQRRTSLTGPGKAEDRSEVSLPARGRSEEKPSVASRSSEFPEKPATPGQGRMDRIERRGKKLGKQEQKLDDKLGRRQDKLEAKLERKQKKLENKEKVLEKKVKALEKALEKKQKRRGRP